MLRNKVLTVFMLFSLVSCSLAFADDGVGDTKALKEEISLLKERINSLERRLQTTETKVAAAPAVSVATGTSASPENGLSSMVTSFAKEIQVHGFVDSSYVFNTNTPVSPNSRTNTLRVFDNDANGFMLNMFQLNLEKLISKESPVGFRVDLDFGEDSQQIHSLGLYGNTNDVFDLQQAYAQIMFPFLLPYMDTLSFKVGKFATLAGAEVIESINNWNFSRSFLFGYAIPFTHTGVRAYYKPSANIP
ncbi:MAG: outer membrane beta-barrel protein, partial [Candidatus Omnitrophota bacterium]